MAWYAPGEGELLEKLFYTLRIAGDVWINLAVCSFQIGIGDKTRAAMAGTGYVNNIEIRCLDYAVQMYIYEI